MNRSQWDNALLLLAFGAIAVFLATFQFFFPTNAFEEVVSEVGYLGKSAQGLYAEWKPRFHLYVPQHFAAADTKLMADLKAELAHHSLHQTISPGKVTEAVYETEDNSTFTVFVRYTDLNGLPLNAPTGTKVPVRLTVLTYQASEPDAENWATSWKKLARGIRQRGKGSGAFQTSSQGAPSLPGNRINGAPSGAPVAPQVGTTTTP